MRYGGYSLICLILFIPISIKLDKFKFYEIQLIKRFKILILITLIVFLVRNVDRIIDEKRHQILSASKKYGKTCSMLVNSIEQAEKWKKEGVLLLNFSSDVSVLMEGYKSAIEKITK